MIFERLERGDRYDVVSMDRHHRLPNGDLFFPSGYVGTSPMFWRWSETLLGYIEVSYVEVDDRDRTTPRVISIPTFPKTAERREFLRSNESADLNAEELISIGFAASFAWRIAALGHRWATLYPGIDFETARKCFEAAAALGHWIGFNNLAVMYRDGLGVPVDLEKAFQLATQAAESLEPAALRALALFYEKGLGVPVDLEYATYLRDLASAAEQHSN